MTKETLYLIQAGNIFGDRAYNGFAYAYMAKCERTYSHDGTYTDKYNLLKNNAGYVFNEKRLNHLLKNGYRGKKVIISCELDGEVE